jgi:hypothetical protein
MARSKACRHRRRAQVVREGEMEDLTQYAFFERPLDRGYADASLNARSTELIRV